LITQDITKEEYERLYPDAAPITSILAQGVGDPSISQWINEDTVRIAEYFFVEYKKATLNLYPNNITAFAGSPEAKRIEAMGLKPIRTRESARRMVKWSKTNGFEFLEGPQDWAGKHIPVVRVVGNEFEVDGKLYVSGIVRNAKDAQRMYNYWVSQETEMLALAPKAPFIGYGGQFEGYEYQWKTANTNNWPYLEVNPDVTDAQGGMLPLPQRAMPPMPQTGLIQAKMGASDDIKATTGQYDASLGMAGNERSGKAILARERQADTGTYHFVDNLARAIRHVTRIIIDLIPKYYDTQRVARIIGVDGDTSMAKIDPTQQEPVRKIMDKPPALQAAEQQMQQMEQQMEQMASMLRNVNQSMEAQELKIKEYDAETKRISAVSSGMTPEQIQDIVQGTLFAALESGDLSVGNMMPEIQTQQLMGEPPVEGAM
jgi:hypothetical protein